MAAGGNQFNVEELSTHMFAQALDEEIGTEQTQLPEQGIVVSHQEVVKEMAKHLKELAKEVDKKLDQLNPLLAMLRVTAETAYNTFKDIASQIFQGTITWGRVAVLFLFGARLAVKTFRDTGAGQLVKKLVTWVSQFFTERLMGWITESGGWSALRTYVTEILPANTTEGWKSAMLFIGGTLVGAVVVAGVYSLMRK